MPTLAEPQWRDREAAHERRIDGWIIPHLERRSRGVSHPVEDFMFSYYSFRPAALRRWQPGLGVDLTGDVARFDGRPEYVVSQGRARIRPRHGESAARQRSLDP